MKLFTLDIIILVTHTIRAVKLTNAVDHITHEVI